MKFPIVICLIAAAVSTHARSSPQADAALVKGCERPDARMVEQALKDGADPNVSGGWREAPVLQLALRSGSAEAVGLLEKAGADFTRKSSDGSTSLHAAASAYVPASGQGGADEVVNLALVLQKGISVREKDEHGREALELAADGSPVFVKMLLEKGAVASPAALAAAMREPNRENVDQLLAAGADPAALAPGGKSMLHALAESTYRPEKKELLIELLEMVSAKNGGLEGRNEAGRTPLLEAAGAHQLTALQWLLEHGADAKAVDNHGNNALILVCDRESDYQGVIEKILGLLIGAGCPMDGVDREGHGPLDKAGKWGNWETTASLMRAGIRPRRPDEMLSKALLEWRKRPAAPAAMRHVVGLLLPAIAHLNEVALEGRPLVPEMVFLGDPYLVYLALKLGAAVDAMDPEGRTALMWASAFMDQEVKEMLLKAGADPLRRDRSGKTAVDWAGLASAPWARLGESAAESVKGAEERDVFGAVASGNAELLKTLLSEKPEWAAEVRFGLTALQWAALHGQVAASALLLEAGAGRMEPGSEGKSPWALAVLADQAEWCRWFLQETGAGERAALVEAAGQPREEEMTLAMAGALLHFSWKPSALRVNKILERNQDGSDPGKVRERLAEWAKDSAQPTDRPQEKPFDPFAPENDTSRPGAGATGTAEELERLLWNAVICQETGVLRFCFAQGMRVKPGSGLLLRAAYLGNVAVARLLLENGADLYETNAEGNLAEHQAASGGRRDFMDLLIRQGTSLTTKNKAGRSAPEEAREAGYADWAEEWERKVAPE